MVSFADGYPLLITNTASLDELGRWLAEDGDEPVPMTRFRPNVVVSGAEPWAEDHWRYIRIGAVPFRVAKPCGRCVVTTTDQVTGERGSQPLKMLGQRRRFGQSLVFGQNLIPDRRGVIRVGDPVKILDAGRPRYGVTASGPCSSRTRKAASSRTGTPSSTALSCLEPAFSPATTKLVFLDTEEVTLPPAPGRPRRPRRG